MEKEKLLEEIDKYIEAHYIPDKYDDIVMDQEMKGIFERITEFRKNRAANKEAVRKPQEIECDSVAEYRPPLTKEDEEKPAFDTSNYTKKKLTKPIHDAQITNRKIDDLMDQLEETFSQRLMRMIMERDVIEADVYKKAYVDRRHFSKIKKDINYSPNKKTVFAFAIALELSID